MADIISTGRLVKEAVYEYVVGSPGRPGRAGSAEIPGHWEVSYSRLCVFSPYSPERAIAALLASIAEGSSYGSFETTSDGRVCTLVQTRTWVPPVPAVPSVSAIPAVPDQLSIDLQTGWNARAVSVVELLAGGRFSFVVPSSAVGVVVGLASAPGTSGYEDIERGFYVSHGVVRIYEGGTEVMYLGAHPEAVLTLRRIGGMVVYLVDQELVRIAPITTAPMRLAAALYTGGDSVTAASFSDVASGVLTSRLPAMAAAVGNVSLGSLHGAIPPLQAYVHGRANTALYGRIAPLHGYAGKVSSGLWGELQGLTGKIGAEVLVPSYAALSGYVMPPVAFLNGLTGEIGTLGGTLRAPVSLLADHAAGVLNGSVPLRAQGWVVAYPSDMAFIDSTTAVRSGVGVRTVLAAVIDAVGEVSGLLVVSLAFDAALPGAAAAGDGLVAQAQLNAVLRSAARAVMGILPPDQFGEAWVLNIDADGMTRYNNYGFDSFAEFDGAYYGAMPDGVYRLEGSTDEGAAVPGSVNFGNMSFGSLARKALPYVYVGMASNGNTYLRVTADGQTYTYHVRHNTTLMKAHRFELGRGLRASFYEIELVSDGVLFDLESIEFQPVELSRRL